jgi:arylesterase / paraoxonase
VIRRAAALAAATLVIVAAVEATAWLLAGTDVLPARFGPEDCRRVALVGPGTGWRIAGGEDLALTPDGETLIVSAHDRRDPGQPDGGLYAVPVRDLAAAGPAAAVVARPLVDPAAREMPFRPHGIALSPDGRRLALVNRVAPREAVVEIGRLDASGWRSEAVVRDPALCRANDLAFEAGGEAVGDAILVTIDRADCANSFRDLVPWSRTGSVVRIDGQALATVRSGLAFPNGIAAGTVAETRAGLLLRPDGREVPLPGAPDNLSADGDALVVAVQADLLRLWLHGRGWVGRSPSRVDRVAADDAVETLFDDPTGALFSGATVGLMTGGGLIAGAARDAGLLVCGNPA